MGRPSVLEPSRVEVPKLPGWGVGGAEGVATAAREVGVRFRKKPIEIEAKRFDVKVFSQFKRLKVGRTVLEQWCGGTIIDRATRPAVLVIPTLEGKMNASLGDWIIRGVKGEFYPCKPDIFDATYEPTE